MDSEAQPRRPASESLSRASAQMIAPSRLRWLQAELDEWVREGIVGQEGAAAIRSRYVGATRPVLLRLVVGLGAAFLAVGLLWLVATNLDQLSPMVRLGAVTALWLGLAMPAQLLQGRAREPDGRQRAAGESRTAHPEHGMALTLASVCRLLAAAAFGAVVFQAAQSMQVPAYEPRLVGAWAIGAIVYAYATFSHGALAVGLLAAAVWLAWFTAESVASLPAALAMVLTGAVAAAAMAALHVGEFGRSRKAFAMMWQFLGAALGLVGLFGAALPIASPQRLHWPVELTVLLATAAATLVVALVLVPMRGGQAWAGSVTELGVAVLVLAAGSGIAAWRMRLPAPSGPADVSGEQWALTGAGVLVFIAAAAWFAVLGARREFPLLTGLALGGLVLFTTVQSFAVFAPIVSGATLFLGVGAIMVATGLLAERIGRRLHRRRLRSRFGGWRSGRHAARSGGPQERIGGSA